MMDVLRSRATHARVIAQLWENDDVHGAVLYVSRQQDLSVWVDLLGALGSRSLSSKRRPALALEVAELVIPAMRTLLLSKYEECVARRGAGRGRAARAH